MLDERFNGEVVAGRSETGYLRLAHGSSDGVFSKFFPQVNVGDVNLDHRDT